MYTTFIVILLIFTDNYYLKLIFLNIHDMPCFIACHYFIIISKNTVKLEDLDEENESRNNKAKSSGVFIKSCKL